MAAALASRLPPGIVRVGARGPLPNGLAGALAAHGIALIPVQDAGEAVSGDPWDALMLSVTAPPESGATVGIKNLRQAVSPWGRLLLTLPPSGVSPPDLAVWTRALEAAGFRPLDCIAADDGHEGSSGACLVLTAVHADYDARAHARAYFDAGDPEAALRVLDGLPAGWFGDGMEAFAAAAERQLAMLAAAKKAPARDRLERFIPAQDLFFTLVHSRPEIAAPYQCHAEFLRVIGRPDLGRRLLDSLQAAYPSEGTARQRATLNAPGPDSAAHAAHAPPPPADFTPRILFVQHPRPHYGLDVLFDGLCHVLGPGAVQCYPHKPWLHGAAMPGYENYPCAFAWPGEPLSLEAACGALKAGEYDFVLWGDCEQALPSGDARTLARAAEAVPLFLVDAVDQCLDLRARTLAYIGRDAVQGYFKREMLAGWDYGAGTHPLPFAYPETRAPRETGGLREASLFWAGHRQFGTRRLILEYVERIQGRGLDEIYPPEEYANRLLGARAGLNLFGYGFDTVRHWELPAHGCLLLTERLPIVTPHPFEDGASMACFDDLAGLEAKLRWLEEEPEAAARIAAAGREHFLAHHTSRARARQMLGWIASLLG